MRAVAQPTEAQLKAVKAIHNPPEAQWRIVDQPFWQAYHVLKLVTAEWPHRPTVAVDESGNGYLLTYRVVHRSRADIFEQFNQIARKENLTITPDTARAYAEFFANAFLGSYDTIRLSIAVAPDESSVDDHRFRLSVKARRSCWARL